jgi:hypothetical protein
MAVHAVIRLFDKGRVVAFDIVPGGQLKHIAGAVGNTKAAALASFFKNHHHSTGNQNFIRIQRNSPIFHIRLPFNMLNTDCPADEPEVSNPLDGHGNKNEQEALHSMHSLKHVKLNLFLKSIYMGLG